MSASGDKESDGAVTLARREAVALNEIAAMRCKLRALVVDARDRG